MIRVSSESCNEKDAVARIKEEMEKVGFDKVAIAPMVIVSLLITDWSLKKDEQWAVLQIDVDEYLYEDE